MGFRSLRLDPFLRLLPVRLNSFLWSLILFQFVFPQPHQSLVSLRILARDRALNSLSRLLCGLRSTALTLPGHTFFNPITRHLHFRVCVSVLCLNDSEAEIPAHDLNGNRGLTSNVNVLSVVVR